MKTVLTLDHSALYTHIVSHVPDLAEDTIHWEALQIDTIRQTWELRLVARDAACAHHIPAVRSALCAYTNGAVTHVVMRPRYTSQAPIDAYLAAHWEDILYDISCRTPHAACALTPSRHHVEDAAVTIEVRDEAAVHLATSADCAAVIAQALQRDIGQTCTVCFVVGDFSEEIARTLDARQKEVQTHVHAVAAERIKEQKKCIYAGRNIKPRAPQSIAQLLTRMGDKKTVTLCGEVLSYTPAHTRCPKDIFCVTDYTSTLECSINHERSFNDEGLPTPLQMSKGDYVSVTGTLGTSFQGEPEVRVARIERIPSPVPQEVSDIHRVELHAHTKMSQMDGLTDCASLIARAAAWGHSAIGITDHGNVHIFPEAYAHAQKHNIKLLLGMEGYLANHDSKRVAELVKNKREGRSLSKDDLHQFRRSVHHIILYAQTPRGRENLYTLVSLSHTDYFYGKPLLPRDVLMQYREGLVIGSACESGEIYQLVKNAYIGALSESDFTAQLTAALPLYDYLEVQPVVNNAFLLQKGILKKEEDLREINRRIVAIGDTYHKDVVATCDVHLLDEKDALLRTILQAGQGYEDSEGETPAVLTFKTTDQMLEEFAYLGEEKTREIVVDTPCRIADAIEDIAPVPSGFHPPTLDGAADELNALCAERLRELYGDTPHALIRQRHDHELSCIIENRFADLYMLAQKIVHKSLEDGYIVGSRGSVGSSFVAYLSGITEVNSLPAHYTCPSCYLTEFIKYDEAGEQRPEHLDGIMAEIGVDLPPRTCAQCGTKMEGRGFDIPFETFVGFAGNKTPDIDLNFASEYQAKAHEYVKELFGEEFVYRAGTLSTLQSKTAFGFVKKYIENREENWTKAEINRVVDNLTGIKRTTGQHPGGVIILPADKKITHFTPVQYPGTSKGGIKTTHFDYHAMEDQLLKLDVLGHDDPTQIRLLCDYTATDVTAVPLNDPKTISLFSSTKALRVPKGALKTAVGTYGISEFGTEFVRNMLEATRPKTFADLIRISGLSHGTDVWINNAQDIIRDGQATLQECICCRDDIMNYLIEKGVDAFVAFTIMERVRKGKGITEEQRHTLRHHGVPEWYITSCERIKYMFPKAHAVAYVINAFRIAYCKVHHPVAFYATAFTVMRHALDAVTVAQGAAAIRSKMAEMTREVSRRNLSQNDSKTYDVLELGLEMCERGIRLRPIDILTSPATICQIVDGEILPPLVAFPGLGDAAAESVVRAREEAPFSSCEDLQRRTQCNRTIIAKMKEAGILASLPDSDQMDIFDQMSAMTTAPPTPATSSSPVAPPTQPEEATDDTDKDADISSCATEDKEVTEQQAALPECTPTKKSVTREKQKTVSPPQEEELLF